MTIKNYEDCNLRGFLFKGKDLRNVNFRNADLRGANFTDATLIGANFDHVKAGLAPSRSVGLIVGSLILVAISGLIIGYSSAFPAFISNLLAEKNALGKELLISVGMLILTSLGLTH